MTASCYRLPPDLDADIDAYEHEVRRYLAGDMPAGVFKARRVPRGVYEQRRDGTFMVRVRVASGTLNAAQTRELAVLSREFGNGRLHITTRQDVQFHDVAIERTPDVMRRLMAVGLTSKGGGGNTVRNVTACPYAGICPAERFDVTPCAHAVTEYLIALVGSYNLPRKYKIAFSGCAADCALAQVADLGFIATVRDGRPGFRVVAGGGMGTQSRIADTLLEWSPVADAIRVAETVRRLFDAYGDRQNKHRARLRFVFDRLGAEVFRERYAERVAEVVAADVPAWTGDCQVVNASEPVEPTAHDRDGIRVIPQRQPGVVAVPLHAPLGFLPAGDLAVLGDLATRYSGEDGLRTTRAQNLLVRFVKHADVPALAAALRTLDTDVLSPAPLDRFVVCAGASTCRLGICLARNAARACAGALTDAGIGRETLEGMAFHVNGCSNACGHQPVGMIGLMGAARRVGERLMPAYGISVGGRCGRDGARLGTAVGKVAAAALPAVVRDLARDFERQRQDGESFLEVIDRLGTAHAEAIVARHAAAPAAADQPAFYRDLGADTDFSLAGRGAGECGAGVFEVIQADLEAARRAEAPIDILIPAVRALLITRGEDEQEPLAVLDAFDRHFIATGLVPPAYRALLDRARALRRGDAAALDDRMASIRRLREHVEYLYGTLDANLEFHPPDAPRDAGESPPPEAAADASPADSAATDGAAAASGGRIHDLDLSGVACPMNFVKAKLRLEMLPAGEALAIVLDDGEPVRNVPASFRQEGQAVEAVEPLDTGRWRVVIRKQVPA